MITSRGTLRSRSRRLRTARVVASNSSVIAISNFICRPALKESAAVYPTRPGRLHLILALGALVVSLIAQQQRVFDFPGSARVASGLHDATHGTWFALVTWFVAGFVRRFAGRGATIAITALLGVGIAIGTEALQTYTGGAGRSFYLGRVALRT